MRRLPRTLVLFLAVAIAAWPQSKTWHGTWSATVGNSGRVLSGTWDASLAKDQDSVVGNWAITDPNGATLGVGTWSARKEAKTWRGSWQARTASNQTYSGTWSALTDLPATTHISGLFDSAATQPVSGTWRMGSEYAGAWSIRAYAEQ